MDRRELVKRYLDAWNRREVTDVLELFHPGAAIYDGLWRESCIGTFLPKYIKEGLEVDEYWYEISDDLIEFEDGVVYRYAGYKMDGTQVGEKHFEGAEVVTTRDNRIVTLSNYYCDPDPRVLTEIAKLSVLRHGESAYVSGGHGGFKRVHIKHRLLSILEDGSIALERDLTVADLAVKIGCDINYILKLVEEELSIEIKDFIGREDETYACELLAV